LTTVETQQTLARIRRDFYSLLSFVYIHIPERKTLELKWEPVLELLGYPQEGGGEAFQQIDKGLRLIRPYSSKTHALDEKALTGLSKDWTHLFRGVEKDGIPPPYESLYRTGKLQEKPAREIYRLFSQMGIRIPDEWHQPPDYIGVELDFMRLLCSRELESCEKQEKDSIIEVVRAEESFVQNHLAAWAPNFCQKMMDEAREGFYRGIARLTLGLVDYDRIYTTRILSNCQS